MPCHSSYLISLGLQTLGSSEAQISSMQPAPQFRQVLQNSRSACDNPRPAWDSQAWDASCLEAQLAVSRLKTSQLVSLSRTSWRQVTHQRPHDRYNFRSASVVLPKVAFKTNDGPNAGLNLASDLQGALCIEVRDQVHASLRLLWCSGLTG
jgi:hypothetical protein